MNWGLVKGKTRTIFPWGSKEASREPDVWFHDILREDGEPFNEKEAEILRQAAGKIRSVPDPDNKPFHDWAPVPPLGWNSWDSFGQAVTEAEVKENADFMAARPAPLGWNYVVVDIEWYEPQKMGADYPVRSLAEIEPFGRVIPAVKKFPSSAGGKGFKALADYIHRKGLKFGVHIVRGAGLYRLAPVPETEERGDAGR